MNWLDYIQIWFQVFFFILLGGFGLNFLVYQARHGWMGATLSIHRRILNDEKNSALKEAMTKK